MKEDNPLISIITVVFDGANCLEKTIESVGKQNYSNIEYIIIDGGSRDGTIDIIKNHEKEISNWVSEPDRGIFDAMNKGIDIANGEWIQFMNAGDTLYCNDTITQIAMHFTSTLNIIYGDTLLKYSDNLPYKYKKAKEFKTIKSNIPFCHQSVFVKMKLMKEFKFDLTYRFAADFDFFLKLFKNKIYEYKRLSIPISIYDMNGVSIGRTTKEEYFKIAQKHYPNSTISIHYYFRLISLNMKIALYRILPSKIVDNLLAFKRTLTNLFLS